MPGIGYCIFYYSNKHFVFTDIEQCTCNRLGICETYIVHDSVKKAKFSWLRHEQQHKSIEE